MRESSKHNSHFYVKIEGTEATDEFLHDMESIVVESSLHLPDMATLVIHDPRLKWVDDDKVGLGKSIEVTVRSGDTECSVFDGEVVEIESHYGAKTHRLSIKALDRLHRLARGALVRTFQNTTDGDVVKKIASEVGLTATIKDPGIVHEYLIQPNISNLQFLRERAALSGSLVYVHGKVLHFEPPADESKAIELKWGESLLDFRPRWSTLNQVQSSQARGWDPESKKEVVAERGKPQYLPQLGGSSSTAADIAKQAFGVEAKALVAHGPHSVQRIVDTLAQAELNRHAHQSIEAEGTAGGNPAIVAGVQVQLVGVGQRYSATYYVTSATHAYNVSEGYVTTFSVSGQNPSGLLALVSGDHAPRQFGVVIGVVTDNNDPKGQGRVKVKFPWLNGEHSSHWARLVSAGAGGQRGIEFIPEVNDEVAVSFEHGDISSPFIIGGLWNGKDAPPARTSEAVSGGKVNKRILRSRSGHIILMDDSSGKESILIESVGDITIKSKGKMLLQAAQKIEIKGMGVLIDGGSGTVDVKGVKINLN